MTDIGTPKDHQPEPAMAARRQSFGAWVEDYHRYRPRYPAALVEQVLQSGPEPTQSSPTVLDLGAGNAARASGRSWARIGATLGTSKRAVQDRFANRTRADS